MAEHKKMMRELERQNQSHIDSQKDKLAAKLAARKRMQEELTKEKAINDEMSRIALAQVFHLLCGSF